MILTDTQIGNLQDASRSFWEFLTLNLGPIV